MRGALTALILSLALDVADAAAQSAGAGRAGPRALLPREREIALARSAAPPSVSRDASVMVLTERGFEVAVRGTTGVTSVVNRSHPQSLEPHCFDAEGSATILPMELRRTELLREGKSAGEIDLEIAAGLLSGKYRLPSRPAMSYMMSPQQVLYSDEGRNVGPRRSPDLEDRIDLERAIERLPEGYREVFVLHDVEGYTHEEIGQLLGIETGTSKSQLSRARRHLRTALAPAGWQTERRSG